MGRAYAFMLRFEALSPILIGSGSRSGNIKEAFKIGKYYVIPASSWKGALRREVLVTANSMDLSGDVRELIAEHLKEKGEGEERSVVSFHEGTGCSSIPEIASRNGEVDQEALRKSIEPELYHVIHESMGADEAKAEICAALKSFACPVDSIFGSMYFASMANFSSSVFVGSPEYRTHASIDRETMAVSERHLFSEENVWPHGDVLLRVTLVLPERKELYGYARDPELMVAIWKKTLEKLAKHGLSIGAGKSRGLGLLKLKAGESLFMTLPESGENYNWKSLDSFL